MKPKKMKRKAFVFTLEALLALFAALALIALASKTHADYGAGSLQRNALAQDLLETSVKNKALASRLGAFAAGNAGAANEIERDWSALLSKTGADCFQLEAGAGKIVAPTQCIEKTRFAATASRALFDGTKLMEVKATLYFNA